MTEILAGIHQLQIPIPNNPLDSTNIYLLQGDNEHLLIDAGWSSEEALQSLREQLDEIDVKFMDISQIIVTHAHFDHYGLASRLRHLCQAKVALHHIDKELLAPMFSDTSEFIRQAQRWFHVHGIPEEELRAPRSAFTGIRSAPALIPPDINLLGGHTISNGAFNLQVVWTPGHSPGHICLYEPSQKILFSGDHVLPIITPNVSLQPNSNDNPLADFINSLDLVKQLDVDLVLPAHEHLFTDLRARVDEIIQHHELRNAEILDAINTEPKTAYQISARITWMPELGGISFQDLAPGDRRMAVSETLAHLAAMRIDGKVVEFRQDDIIYYRHTAK